jgi:hypothetical protein
MDNGCLPISISSFYQYEKRPGQMYQNPSVMNHDQTRSWDVSKGLMEKALKYRLTGFEENEFTATQSGQLTVGADLSLFYKVKEALAKGNSVTVCGWPYYFHHGKLTAEGKGSIANEGDSVVWTGLTNIAGTGSSGNHCVSIIGYDDDITYVHAGVTLKGAFQIMDSYANGPTDIYYIMYDAFNLESEHAVFNDSNFYKYATSFSVENMNFQYGVQATGSQMISFKLTGEKLSLNGKDVPLYTIGAAETETYLSFDGQQFTKGPSAFAKSFAVIPYEEAVKTPEDGYKGGYLVALVENGKIKGYFGAEGNANNGMARFFTSTAEIDKICFAFFGGVPENQSFTTRISLHNVSQNGFTRKGTIYRFSFIYWDKDIAIGTPKLMVEASVSMVSRENIYMTLTRTDKNGSTVEYVPASMDVRYNKNFFPELDVSDPVSFSGKVNPTKAETGYFTFGYHTLGEFSSAADYDRFIWGVTVKGAGAKVLKIRFLDENGKELCAVKPDAANATLEAREQLHFEFRQDKELSTYFGGGVYNFYNAGMKKTLSLQANNMLFEWRKEGNAGSLERSSFRVEYLADKECYRIRHGSKDYVVDVAGDGAKEGAVIKMNAPSATRATQLWTVVINDDGTVSFASKADPTLFFGYDGKNFTLGKGGDQGNYRFIATTESTFDRCLDLSYAGGKVTATASLPKGYTASELKLTVIRNGEVIKTFDPTVNGKTLSFEVSLDKGDALFCLTKDGKAVCNMIGARIS